MAYTGPADGLDTILRCWRLAVIPWGAASACRVRGGPWGAMGHATPVRRRTTASGVRRAELW